MAIVGVQTGPNKLKTDIQAYKKTVEEIKVICYKTRNLFGCYEKKKLRASNLGRIMKFESTTAAIHMK